MVLFALFYGGKMLVLAKNKKIKDLEKYGFKILIKDEEINNDNCWNVLARLKVSQNFECVIENDMAWRQLTIIPIGNIPMRLCLSHQLDIVYQLIKDGMLELDEV